MSEAAFDETLGLIYDVAAAPDRWTDLLRHLGQAFRCHFVGMVSSSPDRSDYQGMAVGVDRAAHQAFLRRFHQNSPLRQAAPRVSGEVLESQAMMPRAEFERTEMYQAFFRPHDMGEGLGLTIWHGATGVQTISLVRPWAAGFDADERAHARAIMPHLQRTALMARHLRRANLFTQPAGATLDASRQPVLLLDRAGRLVHANTQAEALLRTGDGLGWSQGGLVAATREATRELWRLIFTASGKPAAGGSMRLPRASGRPPLTVIATPVRGLDGFALTDEPAVLIGVTDPERPHELAPGVLMGLFGLTRAEEALAQRMLAGQDVNAIAASSARSIHTVRNLLARLMDKTETHRQSDLLRLLDQLAQRPAGGMTSGGGMDG